MCIRDRCRCPCLQFQFPLHRDPRCNAGKGGTGCGGYCVSVPFTSGSSLQPRSHGRSSSFASVSVPFTSVSYTHLDVYKRQPLHRDPRCNYTSSHQGFCSIRVSVPFTSGSSLQHVRMTRKQRVMYVSVPFTSGSSLQQVMQRLKGCLLYTSRCV